MTEGTYFTGSRWVSAEEMTKLRRTLKGAPPQPAAPRPPRETPPTPKEPTNAQR